MEPSNEEGNAMGEWVVLVGVQAMVWALWWWGVWGCP